MSEDPSPSPSAGLSRASRYWDTVLDPQNLERDQGFSGIPDAAALAVEIAFADIPDLEAARRWLQGERPQPVQILDLGAGLGANSMALARRGHGLLAVDTSPARLRQLRRRAEVAGLSDRIQPIVAAAEALPFATGSLPAIYTKSVLIHTDMPRTAREIARALTPAGRAALDEPLTGNPFVNAYRRFWAPKAWRSITRYFDAQTQQIFLQAPGLRAAAEPIRPFYFLSFFAFVFQFAWPRINLFKRVLSILQPLDDLLFAAIPSLRRRAWFGLIKVEKK